MTTVLIECVKINSAIGKYGRRTKTIYSTTETHRIRHYVDEIAQLEYKEAVRVVQRDNAFTAGTEMQSRYNEAVYWEIILKGAKLIDPTTLPRAKGPADGFTMAEKIATKKFMEEARYGISAENQRQCRNFWKGLFEMRKAGVDKILFYRTKEFDSYCKGYPKNSEASLVDTVAKWEMVYGQQIEQLENRVFNLAEGDTRRRSYLNHPHVAQRLEVQDSSWRNAANEWLSSDEEANFELTTKPRVTSADNLGVLSDFESTSEGERDKSIFVSLLPKDDMFLSVCPIIPVREGDFLGVFAGTIRFSEDFDITHGIRGPLQNLWVDYSKVTGTLNQMQVSQPSGPANVRLQWELFNEQDITDSPVSWRVSVRPLGTLCHSKRSSAQLLKRNSTSCIGHRPTQKEDS